VSPIFVDNNNEHTYRGKEKERGKKKKKRRTINGRHQPSKRRVS
jgi:hypothetical protein